jgi:hypothetical protein
MQHSVCFFDETKKSKTGAFILPVRMLKQSWQILLAVVVTDG